MKLYWHLAINCIALYSIYLWNIALYCIYLWKVALIVEDVQDSCGLGGDEVDGGLVVLEVDVLPADLLLGVLLLLQLEDVLVEEVLQCLIGIVDAQLLKAVVVEVLQEEDNAQVNSACLCYNSLSCF